MTRIVREAIREATGESEGCIQYVWRKKKLNMSLGRRIGNRLRSKQKMNGKRKKSNH